VDFEGVRRQVLRRVRYATNTIALRDNLLPPEGPYDSGLTNGLLVIVTDTWPGKEITAKGRMKAAADLLNLIDQHGKPFPYVDTALLQEGIDLTQPGRHGRSDDEFAVLRREHMAALVALDEHPALKFLDVASADRKVDHLNAELPSHPKDRLDMPEPEMCDECSRPTFLPSGWDMFGGTATAGQCIACGYLRSEDAANDRAFQEATTRALD